MELLFQPCEQNLIFEYLSFGHGLGLSLTRVYDEGILRRIRLETENITGSWDT